MPTAKTKTRTREGWPEWAVARMECANCGKAGLHSQLAPHHTSPRFIQWVHRVWASGNAQQTRMGFKIWCSAQCEATWKRSNRRFLETVKSDGHAHQLKIRQEDIAWQQGLVG